jgi:hypothetical protein
VLKLNISIDYKKLFFYEKLSSNFSRLVDFLFFLLFDLDEAILWIIFVHDPKLKSDDLDSIELISSDLIFLLILKFLLNKSVDELLHLVNEFECKLNSDPNLFLNIFNNLKNLKIIYTSTLIQRK